MVTSPTTPGGAAQPQARTSPSQTPTAPGGAASATPPASGAAGTTGPGATASRPAGAQATPVQGEIKKLDTAAHTFEVANVVLVFDENTAVLVDCQRGSTADLKEGARVKAAYVVTDGKNVVHVIETTR
jgi:hypothetical protein